MPAHTPTIEVISGRHGGSPYTSPDRSMPVQRNRWKVFGFTFLFTLFIGLAVTWLRPPLYQSSAILRLSPPPLLSSSGASLTIDEQLVAHQQQLLSYDLLSELASNYVLLESNPLSAEQLKQMLSVSVIAGSHLIRLQGHGPLAEQLQPLLSQWIQRYFDRLAVDRRSVASADARNLDDQLSLLRNKLADQQDALHQFEQQHNIVSQQRDEIRLLGQLKSLGAAHDLAVSDRTSAAATLIAIKEAVDNGQWQLREQDQPAINVMEHQLVALEQELQGYKEIYTMAYMLLDPKMMALSSKVALLKTTLAEKRRESQLLYIEDARQQLTSSRLRTDSLKQQLEVVQGKVQQFNRQLSQYKTLIIAFEMIQSEITEVNKVQLQQSRQPPGVKVLEVLSAPEPAVRPISPDYFRDSGLSLVIAVGVAVMAVLIYKLLNPKLIPAPWFHMEPVNDVLVDRRRRSQSPNSLVHRTGQSSHELLSDSQWQQLIAAAPPSTALLLSLLLSGLRPKELVGLRWLQFDFENGNITLAGASGRILALPPKVIALGLAVRAKTTETVPFVWQDRDGSPMQLPTLDTLLICAGHDGGLADANHFDSHFINHCYLVYLVRQGARLGDLSAQVGYLEPEVLNGYRIYSPPGPSVSLSQINCSHPAVVDEAVTGVA